MHYERMEVESVLANRGMEQVSRAQALAPESGASLCFDTASVRAGGESRLVGVEGAKGRVCTH